MRHKSFYLNFIASIFLGTFLVLQDSVLAKNLGISSAQDEFQIAYLIVTTMWNVISGGAYISVIVPMYMASREKKFDNNLSEINQFFVNCLLFVLVVTIIIFFSSSLIYSLFIHDKKNIEEASALLKITALSLPLQLISSHIIAILYCKSKNYLGVLSSIFVPLPNCVIGTIYSLDKNELAYLLILGCLLQLIFLRLILFKLNLIIFDKKIEWIKKKSHLNNTRYLDLIHIAISSLLLPLSNWALMSSALKLGAGTAATYAYALKPVWLISAFLTTITSSFILTKYSNANLISSKKLLIQHLFKDYVRMLFFTLLVILAWLIFNDAFYHYLFLNSKLALTERQTIVELNNIAIFQLPIYMCGVLAFRVLSGLRKNLWVTIVTIFSFLGTLLFISSNLSLSLDGLVRISLYSNLIWGGILTLVTFWIYKYI